MKSKRILSYLVLVLVLAEALLVLLSWLLSATTDEGMRSLLSSEGIRWFLGNFTDNLLSPPLVWMILLSMAGGSLWQSGLLRRRHGDYRERVALRSVLVLLLFYISTVLVLTVIPHAVLLGATGQLWPSPFSRSLIPIISFGIILMAMCYGMLSGTYKSLIDVCQSLSYGISVMAPFFLLYILLVQLCRSFWFVFV